MIKCVIQWNWCITCSKRVLCRKGSGHSTRKNNHDVCPVVVKIYFVVSHTFLYNNDRCKVLEFGIVSVGMMEYLMMVNDSRE